MKQVVFFLLLVLGLAACEDTCVFRPYDYERHESARVDLPRAKSSIKVDRDELVVRRKIPFSWPKQR